MLATQKSSRASVRKMSNPMEYIICMASQKVYRPAITTHTTLSLATDVWYDEGCATGREYVGPSGLKALSAHTLW